MRQLISITIALFIGAAGLSAQTIQTERLYQKYKGEEGVVSIWLPGIAMKLAASIADLDGEEEDFLRSIKSIRVLTIEDTELYPGVNFVREANINTDSDKYQVLVQVCDSGEDVIILGREKNGKLKDLLILVGGDENVMVHLKGRMNADMIGSLAQIAGLDHIESLSQL